MKTPKAKKPPQKEIVAKICAMLEAKDTGQAKYAEHDKLFNEITPSVKLGDRVDLGNGDFFELVDPFEGGKKKWKPCGVSRWDYKVSRAPKKTAAPVEDKKPSAVQVA